MTGKFKLPLNRLFNYTDQDRVYIYLYVIFFVLISASFTGCADNGSIAGFKKYSTADNIANTIKYEPEKEFLIGIGDELAVHVWRHENLTAKVRVDSAGNIYLPLASKIHALDRTASDVKKEIEQVLSKYIVDPVVTVGIEVISSRKIYILGEVRTPGSYDIDRKITLWEAVAMAGGYTNDAKKDWLFVLSRDNKCQVGEIQVRAVVMKLSEVLQKGGLSEIYYPGDGDIIYVETMEIASVERFMKRVQNILSPIFTFEKIILSGDSIEKALHDKDNYPFIYN